MNSLFVAVFATLAAIVSGGVVGYGSGVVVAGPSGVVTPYGPIGPAGHGLGLGLGLGHGYGAVAAGPALGFGYGLGLGHGIAVRGPATVPAVIAGPSGKIVADGLYGVSHYGHW